MLNATDIFFERRSFFGLFFRRTKLIFDSLDLQARDELIVVGTGMEREQHPHDAKL